MLLKEYLAKEAFFSSPPPDYTDNYCSDINDVEFGLLKNPWTPTSARRDDQLVDSLIRLLEDRIEGVETERPNGKIRFEDMRRYQSVWSENANEKDVSKLLQSVTS